MQAAKESEKEGFVLNELEYTYAVARIRAQEGSLLTQAFEREGMGRSGGCTRSGEDAAAGRGENLGSDLGYRSGFVCF